MNRLATILFALVGLSGAVLGDPGIELTVTTVDHQTIRGRLLHIADNKTITVQSREGTRTLAVADVVRMSPAGRKAARSGSAHRVRFGRDEHLGGRIIGGDAEALRLDTVDLGTVRIPLDIVQGLLRPPAAESIDRSALARFQRGDLDAEDRVLLTNGDIVTGFVDRISEVGVRLDSAGGESTVPDNLVVAARLISAPLADVPEPYWWVRLRHSGTFIAAGAEAVDGRLKLTLPFAETVEVDLARVAQLEPVGGRWLWLSTRTPISAQHTPMMALPWNHQFDRNVLGDPLKVGGETFTRGIGVHSRSSLTFDLEGTFREFSTWFGLDDDTGHAADVDILILVDGKRGHEQRGIRPGRLHGPVRIDVTGAGRLELIVDFGKNGDIQDRFNWIESALIR